VQERSRPSSTVTLAATVGLLVLPALGVRAWMAATFPSYAHGQFGQDLVFAFAWCALLVLVSRWRLLGVMSWLLTWLAYVAWLFLVFGEGVSYQLQADTFNARFFANLKFANLTTGLRAFPVMIGGGIALFLAMLALCAWLLRGAACTDRRAYGSPRGTKIIALTILVLLVLGVDSAPRRLVAYLTRFEQAAHFADTPQGRAVSRKLDLQPVPRKRLVAAPGKNLVLLYLESIERQFWNPHIYPDLMPNLDRLRRQGLDFSGFQTFSGATYTIAGMFASQCGVPLFTSPFAGLDAFAGNTTDAATFHPKVVCLGDVLHKAGYTQVYMGGAPIHFSNKGLFYKLHGYDQALGLYELESQANDKLPESGWGLYDSVLFKLALARYRQLEAAGKPFNLAMITLDTHPPDGRPSPGCPKYAESSNSMLQAIHCTDYEVGKFIDALSKEPDWKNTVVLIMSDHLALRNDAEPLYPKHYHRQPALLVLNAGKGVRPVRMYHMDIAPTLLDLMGVRTNATFIAGDDRSAPNAYGSTLVDNAVTDAVLRKALWSRVNEFRLCRRETLVGWTPDDGFEIGGRELKMSYLGRLVVGVHDGQSLDFLIDNANAKLVVVDPSQEKTLLARRGHASAMLIRLLRHGQRGSGLFSVDWLGRHGAMAHIADVPRLRGLTITSPNCEKLIHEVNAAPAGTALNFGRFFGVETDSPYPPLQPKGIDFTRANVWQFERGVGWLPPEGWGSYAIGDEAMLGFRVPTNDCKQGMLRMNVDPYLPPSRPKLDTQVWINGQLATTWHFKAPTTAPTGPSVAADNHATSIVTAPLNPDGGDCDAQVDLRFMRPSPPPARIPPDEDPRNLQIRVLGLQVVPAASSPRLHR
jgi:arylsulfatase A-like enzyme